MRDMEIVMLLAGLGLLAACAANDPLVRTGLWHPNGSNAADLAMQVANPGDLVRGSGAATSDGQLAAAAVDRLRNDHVKHLPDSNLTQLQLTNSGANNAGGQ